MNDLTRNLFLNFPVFRVESEDDDEHCSFFFLAANPSSGLLQSAVITLYTMYLTWSAMSNEPGKKSP